MFITLPLALTGLGFMIYLLFSAATYVVPIYAALSAGFAALHAGATYPSSMLLGVFAFMLVIMLGQIATLLPPPRIRIAIALLFAVPAAIAGFQVASALLHLGGVGREGVALSLAAALATGTAAAKRYQSLIKPDLQVHLGRPGRRSAKVPPESSAGPFRAA